MFRYCDVLRLRKHPRLATWYFCDCLWLDMTLGGLHVGGGFAAVFALWCVLDGLK